MPQSLLARLVSAAESFVAKAAPGTGQAQADRLQSTRRGASLGRVANMLSDRRYYARRATEEFSRASRALTPQGREWHRQLAESFAERAQERAAAGN